MLCHTNYNMDGCYHYIAAQANLYMYNHNENNLDSSLVHPGYKAQPSQISHPWPACLSVGLYILMYSREHNTSITLAVIHLLTLSPGQTALDGLITAKKLQNLLDVVVRGNYWSILCLAVLCTWLYVVWPSVAAPLLKHCLSTGNHVQLRVRLNISSHVFDREKKIGKLPRLTAAASRL